MFGLGLPELIVILVIALIFFGPGKLPQVGKALGSSIREFKKASQQITAEIEEFDDEEEALPGKATLEKPDEVAKSS
jgi:TatA/E family protein of Tat protein translocase